VDRVRQWRALHPGYWRRSKAKPKANNGAALAKNHQVTAEPLQDGVLPLQDSVAHNLLILGLAAHVFGCTLQDCVEKVIPELIIKGMEIRALMDGAKTIYRKSAKHNAQNTYASRQSPPARGARQSLPQRQGAR
jgi:hypothetical protein